MICCGWRWRMNSERAIIVLLLAAVGCADFERGKPFADAGVPSMSSTDAAIPGAAPDLGESNDAGPPALSFARDVHPVLLDLCARCHSDGGQASRSGLVLSRDAARDLAQTVKFINQENPAGSRLLGKATGTGHEGGAVVMVGTPEYRTILAWITQGSLP
jgi:hypothetical protein